MIAIILDAIILAALLKWLSDAEPGMLGVVALSLGTAVVSALLASMCIPSMGLAGVFVGIALGSAGLGIALSMFYGVDLRRCFLIAGVYMVLSIAVNIGVNLLMSAATSTGQ